MAIHHDSHAYGNLEKLKKDMSEDELLKMLSSLHEAKDEKDEKDHEKKDE